MEHLNPVIIVAILIQTIVSNVARLLGAVVGYLITTGILFWGLSLYSVGNGIAFFGIPLTKPVFLLACLIWYVLNTKEFLEARAHQDSQGTSLTVHEDLTGHSIDSLVHELESSEWSRRAEIVSHLARFRGEALLPMIEALNHRSPIVRSHVAEALGKIQASQAVPTLIELLNDSDMSVRWQAAVALGAIGDGKAYVPLQELARVDPNGDVQRVARLAAENIGLPLGAQPMSVCPRV